MLYSLVYTSAAVSDWTNDELAVLLQQSRYNNHKIDVTGMLLYKNGSFLQCVEGEESVVTELVKKIRRDPRHTGFITLLEGPIERRNFSNWSMGFRHLEQDDLRNVDGFSEFMNQPFSANWFIDDPASAQLLLRSFRDSL